MQLVDMLLLKGQLNKACTLCSLGWLPVTCATMLFVQLCCLPVHMDQSTVGCSFCKPVLIMCTMCDLQDSCEGPGHCPRPSQPPAAL
jgi:hypothetical protein